MLSFQPARWLALTLIGSAALAQPSPQPADSSPHHSPIAYQSALDGYRHFTEEKIQPWGETNGTVRRIGGWRAYAAEAQGKPEPPAAGVSAPSRRASQSENGHQH